MFKFLLSIPKQGAHVYPLLLLEISAYLGHHFRLSYQVSKLSPLGSLCILEGRLQEQSDNQDILDSSGRVLMSWVIYQGKPTAQPWNKSTLFTT